MDAKAPVLASFAADSLALPAHWIYDTDKIDNQFGIIDEIRSPRDSTWHPNRKKGEFSHYGDQALLLLRSLSNAGGFSAEQFAIDWHSLMSSYDGYRDKASKQTLIELDKGSPPYESGSSSADLGGAARIAPLVYRYHDAPDLLLEAVSCQTRLTHNNRVVILGAEILARVTLFVLQGRSPRSAIDQVIDAGISDIDLDMKIRAALDSSGQNSRETIKAFGADCNISSALPGVIHLVTSYEDDLETALVENVMAGGDSAARGLAAGMILGARNGCEAIPASWLNEMRAAPEIIEHLEKMN